VGEHAWGFALTETKDAVLTLGGRGTLGGYQTLGTSVDLQASFGAWYAFGSLQLGGTVALGADTPGRHATELGPPDTGFAAYGLGQVGLRLGERGSRFTLLAGRAHRFADPVDVELRGEATLDLGRFSLGARFLRWQDSEASMTIGTAF